MCDQRNKTEIAISHPKKYIKVDKCLANIIAIINVAGYKTVACCCGHGKYPMTIILKNRLGHTWDLVSNKNIPRKKRFYKKDEEGYYYIPETLEQKIVSRPLLLNVDIGNIGGENVGRRKTKNGKRAK